MECPNCKTANRENAHFCRRCGQFLEADCPNCGHALPQVAVFCDNCGYQVSPVAAAGPQWFGAEPQPRPAPGPRTGAGPRRPESIPPQPDTRAVDNKHAASEDGALLQKYLPGELMRKLEAARESGSMAGERRVVTMLFCDIKGSTAAAEQLDPEEWTDIINGAFEHMIKPVYQFEGTVARLMGDAILAFFGAPIAHEDDPQRAVLAGLEILNAITPYRESVQLQYGLDFNVRVGINTGQVVVGAVGSDLRMEYTAMGDAINLAARMEQTAEPGTVQVAQDTYKLVSPLFDFEALGGIDVKGKEEPVQAYRVLGRKAKAGRLRGIKGLEVPLVGRESELSTLKEAFERLKRGVGGIVSLVADAGFGKSRLIRELKSARKEAANIGWFQTSSQSYETAQPYNLFRRLILQIIQADSNDSPENIRDKIGKTFHSSANGHGDPFIRVYESLFRLESASGDPFLEGESFKQMFVAAIRDDWLARAQRQPVVLVFDDLQWADTASGELLGHLFDLTEKAPVLILISLRPERSSQGWKLKQQADSDYHHRYAELRLNPLSEDDSARLLASLSHGAEIPAQLHQRILEKAAGIPYYLEEVVRGLIESRSLLRQNGAFHWAAAENITDVDLPDSLQSLLVARIDRLEEDARHTLQLASVVGPSFYYRVLESVGEPALMVDRQLDQLVRVDMVREAAREPELEYIFSNVLTQEAAYQTILLRHRRQFHLRVGEALETLFPERREELAPVLAVHFQEANDNERSLEYLTLAGDAAYRMYALDEAAGHYGRALEIVSKNTAIELSSEQLIHLYIRSGRTHEHKYNFEKVGEIYAELNALADQRADPDLKLAYLIALGTVTVTFTPLIDPDLGHALADQALELARSIGDRRSESRAHWNLLLLYRFFKQDLEAAKKHGEIALGIAREIQWEKQTAFILNDLGFVYLGLLDLPKGLEVIEESREIWRRIGNLPMLLDNLNISALSYNFAGNYAASEAIIAEGIELIQSLGNLWNEPPIRSNQCDLQLELGKFGEALENAFRALKLSAHQENSGGSFLALTRLIFVYSEFGMLEKGLEAVEEIGRLKGTPWLSRVDELIHALQARLYVVAGDVEKAMAAIEIVRPNLDTVTVFPFIDHHLALAQSEVWLAGEKYAELLDFSNSFIRIAENAGIRSGLSNFYYYRGLCLLALEDEGQARSSIQKGLEIADVTGSRRNMWRVLYALWELDRKAGETEKAEVYLQRAHEVIQYIRDHAGNKEQGESFLSRPDVKKVLAAKQPI